ncbi:MAG: CPBP family intramembrane glutamic endopeptidase [Candidatus Acidiferrales bacterium]
MSTDDHALPPELPEPPGPPEPFEPGPQSIEPVALGDPFQSSQAPPAGEPPRLSRSALSDDLRVPWDWLDIGLLVALTIGGSAVVGLLIGMALKLSGVSLANLRKSPGTMSVLAIVAQMLLDLGVLAYLAAQMRLRFHSPFWRTIGWRAIETHAGAAPYLALIFGGFALAAIVAVAEAAFPPKHPLPIQTITQSPHAALLFMLTAVLVAPVVEETVFRGYLYPVAARSFGVGMGIVITGTLFGLMHARQLWGGWWQIGLLVIVGIVFTIARAATRTVVASYILHASYNALPVIAAVLSSVKLRHVAPLH